MSDDATPGNVPLSDLLGPPPEPVAWFRAPYGTLEPNPLFRMSGPQTLEWAVACFTEDQLREAIAHERERIFGRIRSAMGHAEAGYDDVAWRMLASLVGPNENRTIYDRRAQLDERARQAAPTLYVALKNLLDAVDERPDLAGSIESVTIQDARQLLTVLRA